MSNDYTATLDKLVKKLSSELLRENGIISVFDSLRSHRQDFVKISQFLKALGDD